MIKKQACFPIANVQAPIANAGDNVSQQDLTVDDSENAKQVSDFFKAVLKFLTKQTEHIFPLKTHDPGDVFKRGQY